jgi:hypothetical protein
VATRLETLVMVALVEQEATALKPVSLSQAGMGAMEVRVV